MKATEIGITVATEQMNLSMDLGVVFPGSETPIHILHVMGRHHHILGHLDKIPVVTAVGTTDPAGRLS